MSGLLPTLPYYVLLTCTDTDEYIFSVLIDEIHNDDHNLNYD